MGEKMGVYGLLGVVVLIWLAPVCWRVLRRLERRQRMVCFLVALGVGALAAWWAVWGNGSADGLWGLLLPLLVPVVMVLGWLGLHHPEAAPRSSDPPSEVHLPARAHPPREPRD